MSVNPDDPVAMAALAKRCADTLARIKNPISRAAWTEDFRRRFMALRDGRVSATLREPTTAEWQWIDQIAPDGTADIDDEAIMVVEHGGDTYAVIPIMDTWLAATRDRAFGGGHGGK